MSVRRGVPVGAGVSVRTAVAVGALSGVVVGVGAATGVAGTVVTVSSGETAGGVSSPQAINASRVMPRNTYANPVGLDVVR